MHTKRSVLFIGIFVLMGILAQADEKPLHVEILRVLQSESKEKQEELVTAILYQHTLFSSKLKSSNMDMERSRRETFLFDLSSEDWKYVKRKILTDGLPSEDYVRIRGASVLIKNSPRDFMIVDFSGFFNGVLNVNNKDYVFEYKYDQSVQKNDESIRKLLLRIQRNEELLESQTAFEIKLRSVFSMSLIPSAHAASPSVVSPLRALSSSISGLFRGFVSPFGRSFSHEGRPI